MVLAMVGPTVATTTTIMASMPRPARQGSCHVALASRPLDDPDDADGADGADHGDQAETAVVAAFTAANAAAAVAEGGTQTAEEQRHCKGKEKEKKKKSLIYSPVPTPAGSFK